MDTYQITNKRPSEKSEFGSNSGNSPKQFPLLCTCKMVDKEAGSLIEHIRSKPCSTVLQNLMTRCDQSVSGSTDRVVQHATCKGRYIVLERGQPDLRLHVVEARSLYCCISDLSASDSVYSETEYRQHHHVETRWHSRLISGDCSAIRLPLLQPHRPEEKIIYRSISAATSGLDSSAWQTIQRQPSSCGDGKEN